MSTEIHLIYRATRALVTPSRLNQEQTLIIDADQNDPPIARIDGSTQHSRRGQRKATTVHGKWYQGTMRTPYILGPNRVYYREYFESTEEEEPHRLVHPDFLGWDDDVSDLNIYRPMNTGGVSRFDLGDEYRATIQWRQINA